MNGKDNKNVFRNKINFRLKELKMEKLKSLFVSNFDYEDVGLLEFDDTKVINTRLIY
jgi:hypothetical protein